MIGNVNGTILLLFNDVNKKMAIRVVVFEDNKKFRESLSVLIDGVPDFFLAGAFPDAEDVLGKIRESRPDVVLMDIELPGVDGIAALHTIKAKHPTLNVLMQTVYEDNERIFHAICNGASGYVLKSMPPAQLLEAIKDTYEGGAPMSSTIAKKVLQLLQNLHEPSKPAEQFKLTPRENEILALMVKGLSYKMIAARCGISFETVRSHIKNIYEKLHVTTMTEAVAKAVKKNLI